ncbi:MAG: carboxypeptidase-like regulatory domain-containing protein, partial [Pyrinomonadaceae bacterium]
LAPTAATVSVSGRVTTASGRGISNVCLTLTDSNGEVRTTTTTSFGYYHFADVRAGETYFLSAVGKRFSFSQPTQVLNINEETDAINFIADSK